MTGQSSMSDESSTADSSNADSSAVDDSESTDNSTQDEPVSVFLPKAALMGEKCEVGDKITLTVKDVDPETGDVEAVCDYGPEEEKGEGGMMDDFDKAMPADQQS